MPIVTNSTTTSSFSHTGVVRQKNEDALLALPKSGLWAVADGMGGHEQGDFASSCIISHLYQLAMKTQGSDLVDALPGVIDTANQEIYQRSLSSAQQKVIGSTLVVLILEKEQYHCFWSGDSRCYLYRDDRLNAITRDHTHAESMRAEGNFSESEIVNHPSSQALTHAIGVEDSVYVDYVHDFIFEDDRFLLCSDGLTKVYDDWEIEQRIKSPNIDQINLDLLSDALSAGAPDNISSILISL